MRFTPLAALASVLLAGCPAPLSRGARAQDAAQELNVHSRFGRMLVAMDRVAAKEKESFAKRHKSWGERIRIADMEMAGMKLVGDEDADVTVRFAWFRQDEGELRVTTLRQKWHDHKGEWLLVAEERLEGDAGLIGDDPAGSPSAPRARENAQFPTIRIGAGPKD